MYVSPQTDRLPHEPLRVRWSTAPFAVRVVCKLVLAVLLHALTVGLWPLLLLGVLWWGWPPNTPRLGQFRRYLRLTWTARPPPPGIAPLSRVYLTLELLQRLARVPLSGLAWFTDELLYGRQLDDTPVVAPLFLLSAARSGSTQISRYLEADPRLAAPKLYQKLAPYRWLWQLVAPIIERVPRRWIDSLTEAMVPEEFVQRHELSLFHTDTFEVMYYMTHLNLLSFCLGPDACADDFAFNSRVAHNRQFWEDDFVRFLDRLGRKTLLSAGPGEDGQPRRLYVKGHFQAADDALAQRYPDAHFVTVIREPVSRLRSLVNHLHGNIACEPLGAVPWAWLASSLPDTAAAYCLHEQEWFTRTDGPARTVIRFTDYTSDLEGTMTLLYRECMGDETLPDHVPTQHTPRERTRYRVDRSLDALKIDVDAFASRLTDYRSWCEPPTGETP